MTSKNFLNQKITLQPWILILIVVIVLRIAYLIIAPPTQTPDETFIFKRIWHTLLSLTLSLGLSTFFPQKRLFLLPLFSFTFLFSLNLISLDCLTLTFYNVTYFPFRTCGF